MFYTLADNLCQKYTALTPFVVRREKFGEVIKLLQWINSKARKEQGIRPKDSTWKDKQGNLHIRRPAMNDNWY
jgi:hypothetical protein